MTDADGGRCCNEIIGMLISLVRLRFQKSRVGETDRQSDTSHATYIPPATTNQEITRIAKRGVIYGVEIEP